MIKSLFKGRIGIRQYWLGALLLLLISIPVILVGAVIAVLSFVGAAMVAGDNPVLSGFIGGGIGFGIYVILLIAVMVPTYGLVVRRYHDVGLSGWVLVGLTVASWVLSFFFPIFTVETDLNSFSLVNFLIALPLSLFSLGVLLWPGTKGMNKYGEQTTYTSIWKAIWAKQPELPSPLEEKA